MVGETILSSLRSSHKPVGSRLQAPIVSLQKADFAKSAFVFLPSHFFFLISTWFSLPLAHAAPLVTGRYSAWGSLTTLNLLQSGIIS